ncbi:MAG: hypothetical protein M3388_09380, partial [Acidobacteriota bacterium]|nr:hypothetical protein [Acidobacteriota bacterium]
AGRLRTASRPSKTVIESAPYSVFAFANFLTSILLNITLIYSLYFTTFQAIKTVSREPIFASLSVHFGRLYLLG